MRIFTKIYNVNVISMLNLLISRHNLFLNEHLTFIYILYCSETEFVFVAKFKIAYKFNIYGAFSVFLRMMVINI